MGEAERESGRMGDREQRCRGAQETVRLRDFGWRVLLCCSALLTPSPPPSISNQPFFPFGAW